MAQLTETESVLILDSLRKYRGIIRLADTPKSMIQELDNLIEKITPAEPTTADIHNAQFLKEESTRNGVSCSNCE
jgi:hypothetical protein